MLKRISIWALSTCGRVIPGKVIREILVEFGHGYRLFPDKAKYDSDGEQDVHVIVRTAGPGRSVRRSSMIHDGEQRPFR